MVMGAGRAAGGAGLETSQNSVLAQFDSPLWRLDFASFFSPPKLSLQIDFAPESLKKKPAHTWLDFRALVLSEVAQVGLLHSQG